MSTNKNFLICILVLVFLVGKSYGQKDSLWILLSKVEIDGSKLVNLVLEEQNATSIIGLAMDSESQLVDEIKIECVAFKNVRGEYYLLDFYLTVNTDSKCAVYSGGQYNDTPIKESEWEMVLQSYLDQH